MLLVLKIKHSDGSVEEVTLGNDDLFQKYVAEAVARRVLKNHTTDADAVLTHFAMGESVEKKDFRILKRALRHFDEVYLCNEILELLEETDGVMVTVGEDFSIVADFSNLSV